MARVNGVPRPQGAMHSRALMHSLTPNMRNALRKRLVAAWHTLPNMCDRCASDTPCDASTDPASTEPRVGRVGRIGTEPIVGTGNSVRAMGYCSSWQSSSQVDSHTAKMLQWGEMEVLGVYGGKLVNSEETAMRIENT